MEVAKGNSHFNSLFIFIHIQLQFVYLYPYPAYNRDDLINFICFPHESFHSERTLFILNSTIILSDLNGYFMLDLSPTFIFRKATYWLLWSAHSNSLCRSFQTFIFFVKTPPLFMGFENSLAWVHFQAQNWLSFELAD